MNCVIVTTVLAAALALAPLAAQANSSTRASQDASMRLHAAWLREVLDLDVNGAVAEYQAIANGRQSRHVRWLAVTRLAELQRVGVDVGPMPSTRDAPAEIKQALAALTPLPVGELLRHARASASGQSADAEPPAPFDLRPATPLAQAWVRDKIPPTWTERQRLRIQARMQSSVRPEPPRADRERDYGRDYANDIVRRELEGKAELAASQRALYFPGWKPTAVQGDPAAPLARVRSHLDAWLKDSGLSRGQQTLLQRLRDEVNARAATDANAALQFVARLPWYGERLLAEPPPDNR